MPETHIQTCPFASLSFYTQSSHQFLLLFQFSLTGAMTRSAVLALLGSLILELGAALPTDHMEQTLHFARQAGLAITENFHPLTRVQRSHRLTGGPDDYPISSGGVANLRAVAQQMQYVTQVGIEEERYYMVVDTGGADTWIVSEEFQCVDPNSGQEIAQERCMFGPLYNRDFPTERSVRI